MVTARNIHHFSHGYCLGTFGDYLVTLSGLHGDSLVISSGHLVGDWLVIYPGILWYLYRWGWIGSMWTCRRSAYQVEWTIVSKSLAAPLLEFNVSKEPLLMRFRV